MTDELLIPVRRCRMGKGVFAFSRAATLASSRAADQWPLGQLQADLRAVGILSRVVRDATAPAAVRVHRGAVAHAEGYELAIAPQGVEIVAATDAGAYYAVQTLRDLLALQGPRLRACRIVDWPDFARRGVSYDCSRGRVPTVATVKALVERLAHWKINELQLYIENVFRFRRHPAIGRGFDPLTAEDILDIQAFCKAHHVRLVPSLASFGHMEHILGLPQYRPLSNMPGFQDYPGGRTLAPDDPRSRRLIEELYAEFVPLFEAEDFNVCCDETWDLGLGRSTARAKRVGVGRVYLDYLLHLRRLCERHGKRMNVWADIALNHPDLLGETPKDIVMLNWDYAARGPLMHRTREITGAGLAAMVCPSTCGYQTHGTRLGQAMQNVAHFAAAGRRCGATGLLNTEWGDYGHLNALGTAMHGFAHGAAHSWHGRAVDAAAFTGRFCRDFFGPGNALAAAVTTVGQSSRRCGENVSLYHGLFEGIDPKADFYRKVPKPSVVNPHARLQTGHIDAADERHLAPLIADLEGLKFGGRVKSSAFEQLAARDIALAAWLDALAARRLLAAQAHRRGRIVPARQWKRLADLTQAAADEFSRLWLTRHRPSRLWENRCLFDQLRRECLKLGTGSLIATVSASVSSPVS